ncbi:restriction endonuclease subunit S [Pedobacter sp. JCM 36344]|uniref:restriction endonuclease subunit S n=1 Tax=Pedobacter sp. JCM 36344 TaxID=3374280 RepID=UPI0039781588
MKKKINELVQMHTGVYAKPQLEGEVYYIQARHFDKNREFLASVKPDLPGDMKREKHYLTVGDVIVASKGYDHFAVAYKGVIKPAVASSMFIVLRIEKANMLLPDFLAWFINHSSTQNILLANSKGTSLPSISKVDIGNLEISIPLISQQQSIIKIQSLQKQAIGIQKQIGALKEQYIQQLILNTLK